MQALINTNANNIIAAALQSSYSAWGYFPVDTDIIQDYEIFKTYEGGSKGIIKLIGREGQLLALRPELTSTIAKAISYGGGFTPPLRFCYSGAIFRDGEGAYAKKQLMQSGVEQIGKSGAEADAEVIAMLASAINSAGLSNFQLDIGHSGIWRGIMDLTPLSPEMKEQARRHADNKSIFGLQKILEGSGVDKRLREIILSLPSTFGDISVIAPLRDYCKGDSALSELFAYMQRLWDLLGVYGLQDICTFDLGIARGLDYYTGFIVKGYAAGIGKPFCSGGRYDNLLGEFGTSYPACGFAIDVDSLSLAINSPPAAPTVDATVTYQVFSESQAIKSASMLRKRGNAVVMG